MAALSAAVEVLKIAVRNLSDCFGEALANQKACADAKEKTDLQITEVLELKQHVRNLDHDAMDQFVEKFNISQYLQKNEDKLKEKQDELMVRARRVLEEVSEAWAKVLELVDAMDLDVDEDGLPVDADEGVQMRRYAGTAKLFLENNTAIINVSSFLQTQRIKFEKVMTAITTEVEQKAVPISRNSFNNQEEVVKRLIIKKKNLRTSVRETEHRLRYLRVSTNILFETLKNKWQQYFAAPYALDPAEV